MEIRLFVQNSNQRFSQKAVFGEKKHAHSSFACTHRNESFQAKWENVTSPSASNGYLQHPWENRLRELRNPFLIQLGHQRRLKCNENFLKNTRLASILRILSSVLRLPPQPRQAHP